MYAIFADSGKQFRVQQGDVIDVDLRDIPDGTDTIEFPHVMLVGEGSDVKIGKPFVDGAKVTGKLSVSNRAEGEEDKFVHKGPKLIAFKYKRRKGYHKTKGHRSKSLRVTIDAISA